MKSCFYCSLKKTENQVFCSIFLIFFKKQKEAGQKSPLLKVSVNISAHWLIGFNSPVDC